MAFDEALGEHLANSLLSPGNSEGMTPRNWLPPQPCIGSQEIDVACNFLAVQKIAIAFTIRYIIRQTTAAEILIIDDVALEVSMSQITVPRVTWTWPVP